MRDDRPGFDTGLSRRPVHRGRSGGGLEAGWAAIRARHGDVPAVVIVVGSGAGKPRDGIRFGHFEALTWQHGTARLPEVAVSGEGLDRTPVQVFTTLLHEATHAVAHVRGIADTSRQGRWHNKRFATLAGELGLVAAKDDKLGWSLCVLAPSTQDIYAEVIAELGAAMRAYRHRPEPVAVKAPKPPTTAVLECDCPRTIRLPIAVAGAGPILCGVCDSVFMTETQREEAQSMARHAYDPTGQWHGGMPTFPYRLAPAGWRRCGSCAPWGCGRAVRTSPRKSCGVRASGWPTCTGSSWPSRSVRRRRRS